MSVGVDARVRPLRGEGQRDAAAAGAHVDDDAARRRPRSSSSAASTRSSVSGRGIRTSGVTTKSWRQKACVPVRCWSGRRARALADERAKRAAASGGQRRSPARASTRPVPAEHVAQEQLGVEGGRRRCRRAGEARASAVGAAAVGDGSGRGGAARARGAFSFSAWLCATRRVHDLVEVAVQDLLEAVEGEADAVVGDAGLLEVVGADLLAAVAAAHLALAVAGDLAFCCSARATS